MKDSTKNTSADHSGSIPYSVINGSQEATRTLQQLVSSELPSEVLKHLEDVTYTTATDGTQIYFPCPFKETEATVALKSVEASVVAAIADLRYGEEKRKIEINLEQTATFLFSTYIATIAGMNKQHPDVKSKLKDTDLLKAQAILYRRLSANLYETKNPGEYFHIHGSLEAGKTLNMIGLEAYRPDLTDYRECIDVIEKHVKQYTAAELEIMNAEINQAGVTALKWEDFKKTGHGQTLLDLPPWQLDRLQDDSPPCPFPEVAPATPTSKPQVLSGIRVLELCRIIAGPAMGRTLAEYGAQVIKVTSPNLSDVPFFQVDGNTGKHTADIDLKTPNGRATFEELLTSADVILDGYRPGALERLGYGPENIVKLVSGRGKGIVYVSEDCFGYQGEWAGRPGWQQIADCVTGVAWAQGEFMGLNEPVVPPFPMSDYGTGCMGAIAALVGLFRRAKEGGSWRGTTSLCQYDVFLLGLGLYGDDVKKRVRKDHDDHFFDLRHADSVDEVGGRALKSMRRAHPELFDEKNMQKTFSKGFGEEIKWCRSPVSVEGIRVGFERASRPNGYDKPTWEDWEVEKEVVEG
ncbi:putative caib baif family enzyme protein [Botrytis fragariae]|uniref:Putative caib baif family enzyme protein n=1 Tax=Botrytis fragariae TaxID=1964551 RepID=A0A8H6ATR3_9HELO|nr:putative caib baif family enzyme protein [Botrytis fragariae]KAF5873441.1 putative caib baif family enzyme protein [Botrytis fragariae]